MKLSGKKGLFLDVNLKTRFFEGQAAKVNKSKIMSYKKKILSDLTSEIMILFKKKNYDSARTYVLKKYIASEFYSKQILRA